MDLQAYAQTDLFILNDADLEYTNLIFLIL